MDEGVMPYSEVEDMLFVKHVSIFFITRGGDHSQSGSERSESLELYKSEVRIVAISAKEDSWTHDSTQGSGFYDLYSELTSRADDQFKEFLKEQPDVDTVRSLVFLRVG